jgi:uncharacterized protein YjiS (DUF1127 family)
MTLCRSFSSALRAASWRLLGWLSACHRQRRDRRLLANLDQRMLRDLGFDRVTIADDTQGFWR